MTIIRNGVEIELTWAEVQAVVAEEHRECIRCIVDGTIETLEEFEYFNLNGYDRSEYASAEDARADLVRQVVDWVIELENTYGDDYFGRGEDYADEIEEIASDMGLIKRED